MGRWTATMFAADGASRADRAQMFLRGRAYL